MSEIDQKSGEKRTEKGPDQAPPMTEEQTKTIVDSFVEEREKTLSEFRDTYKPKVKASDNDKLSEISQIKFENVMTDLEGKVNKTFENHYKEYKDTLKTSQDDWKTLLDETLKKAKAQAKGELLPYEAALEKKASNGLTTESVADIDKTFKGIEAIMKGDPKFMAIFNKIDKREELTRPDYAHVCAILSAKEVMKIGSSPEQGFNSTTAGVLVGMMDTTERVELIKVFMESPSKNDTFQLVDSFLRAGLLENEEAEQLMNMGMQKGLLTQPVFNEFKNKLEAGFYRNERIKYEEAVREAAKKGYEGKSQVNPMKQFVGAPLLGLVMEAYFAILYGLNAMANKSILPKNVYMGGALIGGMLSHEMRTGAARIGKNELLGKGDLTKAGAWLKQKAETIGEDETDPALEDLNDILTKGNQKLREYLINGGIETLLSIRKERKRQKKSLVITLSELMEYEKNLPPEKRDPDQLMRLQWIQNDKIADHKRVELDINKFADLAPAFEIETSRDIDTKIIQKVKTHKAPKDITNE